MNNSLVKSPHGSPASGTAISATRIGVLETTATPVNASRAIAQRTMGDSLPKYVTAQQVREVLAQFQPLDPAGLFILALWQTGARVSELLAATVGDLNFADGTVRLRTLKRRKRDGVSPTVFRLVPLQNDLLGQLGQYIAIGLPKQREGEWGQKARLWPRTRTWAWTVIRKAFRGAGVDLELCHPHSLRHGHVVHALKAGVPITAVQETVGHASIQTTAGYGRLSLVERRRAYQGADFEVRR